MIDIIQNFTEESCMLNKNSVLMLTYLDYVAATYGPYDGHVLAISATYLLLEA